MAHVVEGESYGKRLKEQFKGDLSDEKLREVARLKGFGQGVFEKAIDPATEKHGPSDQSDGDTNASQETRVFDSSSNTKGVSKGAFVLRLGCAF